MQFIIKVTLSVHDCDVMNSLHVTIVMFVDVGENRAVLDNLSYSFVSAWQSVTCICDTCM